MKLRASVVVRFFTLLCLLTVMGCSFFQKQPSAQLEFVLDESIPKASVQEIEHSLAKKRSNAGGFYEVVLTPISFPLVFARTKQLQKMRGLDVEQEKRLLQRNSEKFLESKTCFEVEAKVTRHKKAAQLSDWKAELFDGQKRFYRLSWTQLDPIVEGSFQSSHGKLPQWLMGGVLCAQENLDMSKGMEVILRPPFVPWPFPKEMSYLWLFKGSEQEKKEKRRSYKRYRGY